MARADDLEIFSKKHGLSIVYISDIVEYRLANEQLVKRIDEEESELRGIKVEKITYQDHLDRKHTVIQFYKSHETANVKFHNISTDICLVLDDKRFSALNNSIEYLKNNGGTLIFLDTKVNIINRLVVIEIRV